MPSLHREISRELPSAFSIRTDVCFTGDSFLGDDEVRFDFDQMLAHLLDKFLFHLKDASEVFLAGYFDIGLHKRRQKLLGEFTTTAARYLINAQVP